MSKINFYLKDAKSKEETLIFLVLNINNKRLKYSTGEYIHPNAWDFSKKKPINSVKYPLNTDIDKELIKYEFFLKDLLAEFRRNNADITPALLKTHLDQEFKDIPINKRISFFDFANSFIKECESGKRLTPKGRKYKSWTIKGYKTLINVHLEEYCKSRKIASLSFENIDLKFYHDFSNYFIENDYAINTIAKHIKNIKVIMNASFEDGLHNNLDYKKKAFKIITEETDAIYLNEKEIQKIYEYDFTNNAKLEKVRDLFIIAARTALRFGDLEKIKKHYFIKNENGNFLQLPTGKTVINVTVPLKKEVIEIFNKYNGRLPRCLSNQKMNEYLKEIGKIIEINTIISKSITKGGIRNEQQFYKHELITTHTARRSAATNMFLAGVPTISIMKITGHKTEKAFMKYIRISGEENAINMAKHDYFKNDFKAELKIV